MTQVVLDLEVFDGPYDVKSNFERHELRPRFSKVFNTWFHVRVLWKPSMGEKKGFERQKFRRRFLVIVSNIWFDLGGFLQSIRCESVIE